MRTKKHLFLSGLVLLLLTVLAITSFSENRTLSVRAAATATDADPVYTVTFDGNGKAGTLFTLQVPSGKTIDEVISESEDPDQLWKQYYAETDAEGNHYRVRGYYAKSEDSEEDPPFIVLQQSAFSTLSPITSDLTLYAIWEKRIDLIEITITKPTCGEDTFTPGSDDDWLWMEQENTPKISVPKDQDYTLPDNAAYWVSDSSCNTPLNNLFEGGKTYYIQLYLDADNIDTDSASYYSSETKLSVEGGNEVLNQLSEEGYVVLSTTALHTPKKVSEKAAGCTTAGIREHYECAGCDTWFYDEACTNPINNKKAAEITALGHLWDAWTVTKAATANETGLRVRVCKRDSSHKETEIIPKLTPQNQTPSTSQNQTPATNKNQTSPATGDRNSLLPVCMLFISAAFVLLLLIKVKPGFKK